MICRVYCSTCFLGGICTIQILHNLSQRQVKELDNLSVDDQDHDLSLRGVSIAFNMLEGNMNSYLFPS